MARSAVSHPLRPQVSISDRDDHGTIDPRADSSRRLLTTQRVIIIAFASIEAVAIGWAIAHALLGDIAR
jgi:hypothetical protein